MDAPELTSLHRPVGRKPRLLHLPAPHRGATPGDPSSRWKGLRAALQEEAKEVHTDITTCAHQQPWRHEAARLAEPLGHGATRDVSDGKHPIHPCGVLSCAEMLSLLAQKEK